MRKGKRPTTAENLGLDPAEVERAMVPFVMSGEFDHVSGYIDSGRRFGHTATGDLKDMWLETLRKLPPNPAELHLRSEAVPIETATSEMEAFIQSVQVYVTDQKKTDPDEWN
jgi:hypothetical protein